MLPSGYLPFISGVSGASAVSSPGSFSRWTQGGKSARGPGLEILAPLDFLAALNLGCLATTSYRRMALDLGRHEFVEAPLGLALDSFASATPIDSDRPDEGGQFSPCPAGNGGHARATLPRRMPPKPIGLTHPSQRVPDRGSSGSLPTDVRSHQLLTRTSEPEPRYPHEPSGISQARR